MDGQTLSAIYRSQVVIECDLTILRKMQMLNVQTINRSSLDKKNSFKQKKQILSFF